MRVAYYFATQTIGETYSFGALRSCFKCLLSVPAGINTVVRDGDLIYRGLCSSEESERITEFISNPPQMFWHHLLQNWPIYVNQHDIFCVMFKSIPVTVSDRIHQCLVRSYPLYLGASQVSALIPESWKAHEGLSLDLRVIDKNIRPIVSPGYIPNISGEIDFWLMQEFQKIGFKIGEPYEMGFRHSFLDPILESEGNKEYEHDKNLEKASIKIYQTLGNKTGEIAEGALARIDEFDFRLSEGLASAIERLVSDSPDAYRHSAATCRIILEFLADAVYRPRNISDDGHEVEREHYRNRLIAYAKKRVKIASTPGLPDANTRGMIERIDNVYDLASRGVHLPLGQSLTVEEALSLVMDLLFLVDELLPQPSEAELVPNDIKRFRDMLDKLISNLQ